MHHTFPLFLSFPFLENTSWAQPLSPFSKRKSFAQKYNRRPTYWRCVLHQKKTQILSTLEVVNDNRVQPKKVPLANSKQLSALQSFEHSLSVEMYLHPLFPYFHLSRTPGRPFHSACPRQRPNTRNPLPLLTIQHRSHSVPARVTQNPSGHHAVCMVSGQETLFLSSPVSQLTTMVSYVRTIHMNLHTQQPPSASLPTDLSTQ